MGTLEHGNITSKKKKIIFAIFIFALLFFVLNADVVKAEGSSGPCNEFCGRECPTLQIDGEDFDYGCRKIGLKSDGATALCSCCQCTFIDLSKNKNVVCDCNCQDENKIKDCYVGGLFGGWRTAVCSCCGDCTLNDLLYIGVSIAELILKYLGVIALFIFILGGIIWITSGGAQEKVKKGTAIIKGAIIGIIIVITAFLVVRVIMRDILKVDSEYLPESSSREYKIS